MTNDTQSRITSIRIENIMERTQRRSSNIDGRLNLCERLEDRRRHDSGDVITQRVQLDDILYTQ